MITTLKQALIVAAVIGGVMWINNMTGNKIGTVLAA